MQADRQTNRQADRGRQINQRQAGRETDRDRQRQAGRQAGRQADRKRQTETGRQAGRQIDRRAGRQTETQATDQAGIAVRVRVVEEEAELVAVDVGLVHRAALSVAQPLHAGADEAPNPRNCQPSQQSGNQFTSPPVQPPIHPPIHPATHPRTHPSIHPSTHPSSRTDEITE